MCIAFSLSLKNVGFTAGNLRYVGKTINLKILLTIFDFNGLTQKNRQNVALPNSAKSQICICCSKELSWHKNIFVLKIFSKLYVEHYYFRLLCPDICIINKTVKC